MLSIWNSPTFCHVLKSLRYSLFNIGNVSLVGPVAEQKYFGVRIPDCSAKA